MAEKDPNDPSNISAAYAQMAPKWSMIDTLLDGTAAMREAGSLYLPKHDEESEGNYSERLSRCTLFNVLELTLDSMVGRPFSEKIEIDPAVPQSIQDTFADIDLQGSTFELFCRNWFREGLAKGLAHVLIDMPKIAQPAAGQPSRTRADDIANASRPNWTLVKPESLIFAYAETVAGAEVLKQIRVYGCEVVMDGFVEVFKEQIKVISAPEPGSVQCSWSLYELQKKTKSSKPVWVNIESGVMDIDTIPLVTFYSNRKDFMMSKPPLEDLAYLNVRHWQSTADQINILTVARFPMLAASGVSDQAGAKLQIGPKQLLTMKDPTGKFYYVEHEGKAIEAGRQDLVDIEESMSNYGAEFLRRRPGNATATAAALDSSEAISPLEDITKRFNVIVNLALAMTGKWLDESEVGTVIICSDFGPDGIIDADLRTLVASLASHAISVETYLKELQRRGLLDDKLEPKTEFARIVAEGHMPGMPTPTGAGRPDGSTTGGANGVSGTGRGSGGIAVHGNGAGGL